jgi:transposase
LLAPTLNAVAARGLLAEIDTVHLDRGYDANTVREALAARGIDDAVIVKRRTPSDPKPADQPLRLGLRWAVERTNSWFVQLRAATPQHRPVAHPPAGPTRARHRTDHHDQAPGLGGPLDHPITGASRTLELPRFDGHLNHGP